MLPAYISSLARKTVTWRPRSDGYLPLWPPAAPAKVSASRKLKIASFALASLALLFAVAAWFRPHAAPTRWLFSDARGGVLLVSAYYPFPSAKHSQDEYNAWIGNFLSKITSDVYFFTTPEMADTVRRLRGDLPIVIDTRYPSPFDIEPLRGRRAQVEHMHELDRERAYHNADLYAVWAAKPFFVNEALDHLDALYRDSTGAPPAGAHPGAQASHFVVKAGYRYAFWLDCGSFRDPHVLRDWPDLARVDEVWAEGARRSGTAEEELVLVPMLYGPPRETSGWKEDQGPIDIDMSEGSFFGGHPSAMRWWYRAYFTYFFSYADSGMFVGKDQTLMNALMYLFPQRIINVWYDNYDAPERGPDGQLGACGNSWYYFEYWLASRKEQLKQATAWDRSLERECKVSSVLSFADVLRYHFGNDWEGPNHTLPLIDSET